MLWALPTPDTGSEHFPLFFCTDKRQASCQVSPVKRQPRGKALFKWDHAVPPRLGGHCWGPGARLGSGVRGPTERLGGGFEHSAAVACLLICKTHAAVFREETEWEGPSEEGPLKARSRATY